MTTSRASMVTSCAATAIHCFVYAIISAPFITFASIHTRKEMRSTAHRYRLQRLFTAQFASCLIKFDTAIHTSVVSPFKPRGSTSHGFRGWRNECTYNNGSGKNFHQFFSHGNLHFFRIQVWIELNVCGTQLNWHISCRNKKQPNYKNKANCTEFSRTFLKSPLHGDCPGWLHLLASQPHKHNPRHTKNSTNPMCYKNRQPSKAMQFAQTLLALPTLVAGLGMPAGF